MICRHTRRSGIWPTCEGPPREERTLVCIVSERQAGGQTWERSGYEAATARADAGGAVLGGVDARGAPADGRGATAGLRRCGYRLT